MLAFRELGIGIVPYSPLGRGFFAGRAAVERVPLESLLVNEIYTIVIIFYSNVIVRLCCVCVCGPWFLKRYGETRGWTAALMPRRRLGGA